MLHPVDGCMVTKKLATLVRCLCSMSHDVMVSSGDITVIMRSCIDEGGTELMLMAARDHWECW